MNKQGNQKREIIKRKQIEHLELKSTIAEKTNSLWGFNSRFEQAADRISELEDRVTEITQSNQQKEKII